MTRITTFSINVLECLKKTALLNLWSNRAVQNVQRSKTAVISMRTSFLDEARKFDNTVPILHYGEAWKGQPLSPSLWGLKRPTWYFSYRRPSMAVLVIILVFFLNQIAEGCQHYSPLSEKVRLEKVNIICRKVSSVKADGSSWGLKRLTFFPVRWGLKRLTHTSSRCS